MNTRKNICIALLLTAMVGLSMVCPRFASAQGAAIYIRLFDKASPIAKGKYIELIARSGTDKDLRWLLDRTLDPKAFDDDLRLKSLQSLATAAKNNKTIPAGDLSPTAALLDSTNDEIRLAVLELAGLWKVESLTPKLQQLAIESPPQSKLQQTAITALTTLGKEAAEATFLKLAAEDQSSLNRQIGIAALAQLDASAAAKLAVNFLANYQSSEPPGVMLQGFLDQQNGSKVLAAEIQAADLPADQGKLMLRYLFSVGRNDEELVAVLNKLA